ncbi:uncharacterized protein PGTG_08715 [Puccinia graminis f. sp. tritici CRL 75-36-700-3]|uniref:Blue (type 1) copper domain-containing protein n=1 Tax=Puccinia graminis f. sp. tritici (strain CRL 75-36-700-3 / race SCCL) TaxID=418459 RepID=E3KGV4_PUCGT|nr:uncharacterized protein PGTG_08715 [Puccinia graminis f. sp. tritici CRL 75-36-700-3]EFP83529.2 hypothetical protein PGTG_08715 [Puccinia graminis f. sp. tritici CRL 75-36-700-3]
MSKLFHFLLVFVTWASIVSPLSSQGPPPPPPEKKTNPGQPSNIPQGKNFVIKVGNEEAAKIFSPATIQAQVGDMVTFEFHPKAHTVAQASFDKPCEVLASPEGNGFNSGKQTVELKTPNSNLPRWTMQITKPETIWFYCDPHCGLGMVGAINPPTSGEKTFEKYVENSKKAGSKPKNLRAGSAAAPGDPALRLGENPGDKNAGRLADKAGGQTTDLAGAKPGGQSGTLQRGPPKTANEVATLNANSASVDGKDPSTLASKGKDGGSGAASYFMEKRRAILSSVSLSMILPGVLTTIY